ncbi:dienelactone hydrolase family protein [Alteraurantiacibacter aestuarii]|uniref:Dienelactone hydrolase family protein n=1 Tax=Alteraurantiacibacter aestuarii TaxID=650004 RepID=A0A844ZKG3_9SPHN|nr:dienelactone hydrolase family protein [Alteraurantiacibacter aestuarii]MXO88268.1 dienelactone hydrolase family protein [Alteraurantiacibacter aestuarii]
MCDQDILDGMATLKGGINRRQFAHLGVVAGAGATLAACTTTSDAASGGVVETAVSFAAPGGTMDGFFYHPATGKHPAVIMWPDIAGIRDAKKAMARRLAEAGYAVFLGNPYYRSAPAPQFADFEDWRANDGFAAVRPWMAQNTPEAIMETVRAVVGWLDGQAAVDSSRGIGTQGYCMTGSWTIYGLAAVPGRVKAAGSFHGGGLVGEAANAPVNMFDDVAADAHALIAIAQNDDANAPDDKVALRASADAAGLDATIEVYAGDHGWTVLDSPVYNEAEAERAWANLLALYSQL